MSRNHARSSVDKRALKRELFGSKVTKPCCFCRTVMLFEEATLEHVVPLAVRVDWSRGNLRLSCEFCNRERGTQDFDTFQREKRARLAIAAIVAEVQKVDG